MNNLASCSIGVFDSGLGGLTVMKEISRRLPFEEIVYFADTARVPYGCRSQESITRYSIENVVFLMKKEIKILVVACNTVSACALGELKKRFKIPIIGMFNESFKENLEVRESSHVAVLGTKATVSSKLYEKLVRKKNPRARVSSIACPLFVPLIEEGFKNHSFMEVVMDEYISPIARDDVDLVILGCTHYPFLKERIQKRFPKSATIIDPARSCAEEVEKVLSSRSLKREEREKFNYTYFVSGNLKKFCEVGGAFWEGKVKKVFNT